MAGEPTMPFRWACWHGPDQEPAPGWRKDSHNWHHSPECDRGTNRCPTEAELAKPGGPLHGHPRVKDAAFNCSFDVEGYGIVISANVSNINITGCVFRP